MSFIIVSKPPNFLDDTKYNKSFFSIVSDKPVLYKPNFI